MQRMDGVWELTTVVSYVLIMHMSLPTSGHQVPHPLTCLHYDNLHSLHALSLPTYTGS